MAQRWKFAVACAVVLAPLTAARAQSAPAASPLTIFITAQDASPLTSAGLRVTVDKKPVQVVSVRSAKADKLVFVLLVDTSTSQAPYAGAIRQTANRIFQQLSSRGEVGYFGTFTDSLHLSNAPTSAGRVQKVLDGTQFFGGTSLYDAVAESARQLTTQAHPDSSRRVIIVLSDGSDDHSDLTLEKLLDAVEPEEIPIVSLVTPKSERMGRRALKLMSSLTGGEAIEPKDVQAGVAPLLDALDHQWELTIAAPPGPSGKLYPLSVATKQKHVHISAPEHITLP